MDQQHSQPGPSDGGDDPATPDTLPVPPPPPPQQQQQDSSSSTTSTTTATTNTTTTTATTTPPAITSSPQSQRRVSPANPPLNTSSAEQRDGSAAQARKRHRGSISSPGGSDFGGLSPGATDRVFPIRSVVQVDPTATPAVRARDATSYFGNINDRVGDTTARRQSASTDGGGSYRGSDASRIVSGPKGSRYPNSATEDVSSAGTSGNSSVRLDPPRLPPQAFTDIIQNRGEEELDAASLRGTGTGTSQGAPSIKSVAQDDQDLGGLITARFKHVVTEGGHAVITGRDGDVLQRCEDEPIHIPGAVQGFGLLIALAEHEGKFQVRIVSENSKRIIGFTPKELFDLESFTDILSEEQADNLLDQIDFIREEDADVAANGPEVFTMSVRAPKRRAIKLWCAVHINERNPDLIICEFELEDDIHNPLVPPDNHTPELAEDTLGSNPTAQEYAESTENISRPLRVLRTARKRRGEAAAMEVFNIMSQVQEQLSAAPTLDRFLKVLVGVVKELTGFHRVMIYQFDHQFNGKVVTELVDPRATKDLYHGLHFPASDIPKQARELYKINKVRMLYDRDQETARLVCRTLQDLETPLDLTYSYLRAMSPIHIKYLANMAVRSSMSISINAFGELWGLISCHTYGPRGMRVAFPIRKMCRLVGDTACRNIERLSYASRLQARKLINTAPTEHNPSGYIIASSEDLLKLFNADCGLLSIRDETKILGRIEQSQEALAMLEYLRMRRLTSVMTSQDIVHDFPDLKYQPGFSVLAGMLFVPLSAGGQDFIVFFRKGQLKEVRWAGNPYEKVVKEGTEGYLEPRKSFKLWSEMVVGRCKEWSEEEVETAAVLCLVYGKFIDVWRQKEAALQNSQLTRLLLANSAHEVRTPLNAIINYLEIALEGSLDQETRDNLAKSHSASKSLIYVINDLLDLTKTEEGFELIKGESFDLRACLKEATDPFSGDAKRKGIAYEVIEHPGLPNQVIGDQRRVRQAISNVTANAIQNTSQGSVKVEMYVVNCEEQRADVELVVSDTGVGMSDERVDNLFRDLEQVQSDFAMDPFSLEPADETTKRITGGDSEEENRTLGLGLAVVARIIRNMNGQMRLKSEEGVGSRFVLQFPFDLPEGEQQPSATPTNVTTPNSDAGTEKPEVTLVQKDETGPLSRRSSSTNSLQKRASAESLNSLNSKRSLKSQGSGQSARSDVDRLIEAIQEPPLGEGRRSAGSRGGMWGSSSHTRPSLESRHSYSGGPTSPQRRRARSTEHARLTESLPIDQRELKVTTPGEETLPFTNQPLRAIKVPDDEGVPVVAPGSAPKANIERPGSAGAVIGEVAEVADGQSKGKAKEEKKVHDAKKLHVLVAEDDPINSKIIKKRLESKGHVVKLTTNGEECAGAYCEGSVGYDLVLMDMQMPIVDGLTSTKMIRSFEKTHTSLDLLSERAQLNGRIPIIAVSASLVERERQTYIDAGFDAWILKPVSFDRLQRLFEGIVDERVREECLYRSGKWEQGGWFEMATSRPEEKVFEAKTKPDASKPSTNLAGPPPQADGTVEEVVGDTSAEQGVDGNDMARVKSASAPGVLGSDASTPRMEPMMVTDENLVSETPEAIPSPPPT